MQNVSIPILKMGSRMGLRGMAHSTLVALNIKLVASLKCTSLHFGMDYSAVTINMV